jgi:hypothetical protein
MSYICGGLGRRNGRTIAESPKLASAEPIVSVHCCTNGSSLVAQLLAQKADEAVSCMETEEHSCIHARTH